MHLEIILTIIAAVLLGVKKRGSFSTASLVHFFFVREEDFGCVTVFFSCLGLASR
jgi:hypothetical protein